MSRSLIHRIAGFSAVLMAGIAPTTVQACAVCMSGADSHNGEALNGAIFLMLGFIGAVFCGIGAVAYSFMRRARNPLPPHAQFTETFPSATDPLS